MKIFMKIHSLSTHIVKANIPFVQKKKEYQPSNIPNIIIIIYNRTDKFNEKL